MPDDPRVIAARNDITATSGVFSNVNVLVASFAGRPAEYAQIAKSQLQGEAEIVSERTVRCLGLAPAHELGSAWSSPPNPSSPQLIVAMDHEAISVTCTGLGSDQAALEAFCNQVFGTLSFISP